MKIAMAALATVCVLVAESPAMAETAAKPTAEVSETTGGQDVMMCHMVGGAGMKHMGRGMAMERGTMMGMGPGMMGGGPGMMGMGPGMMGADTSDPKAQARMLRLRGDMMKAMGDVLLKHAQALEREK